MKTFLSEVIEDLIEKKVDFVHARLIIPGVRPKAFIRKTFTELGYRGILPSIQTIEELLEEISSLKKTTAVPLLFSAYNAYLTTAVEPKSFEEFLKFAPTLLKDFDDIDAGLTDYKALFENLISEERLKAWGVTMDVGMSELMKNHLGFWTDAMALFYELRQNLLDKGIAYPGLMARKAGENASDFIQNSENNYFFIGFNALTSAEIEILKIFVDAHKADIYQDADNYYLDKKNQEAGDFLRKLSGEFKREFKFVNQHFIEAKNLQIVKVPKQETQAKFVGNYLQQISPEQREKTAIVLADEQLLPAILNALPPEVEKLNITMGLGLNMVTMSVFFKQIFNLHLTREKFGKSDMNYYRNVLDILLDSNFRECFLPESDILIQKIHTNNLILLHEKELLQILSHNPFYQIFQRPEKPVDLLEILISWIDLVYTQQQIDDIQQEYLYRFRSVFVQLKDELHQFNFIETYKSLYQLYLQLLLMEKISFIGEPLIGLQLLGMLETRLLDFENIILTSVNEGTLPLGRKENTFIPFDFRKAFGLNTFIDNDAIYAYHFYRLIQRCKNAIFLYNSDEEGVNSGEPSRFLTQLILESPHQPIETTATPSYSKTASELLTIPKTAHTLHQLNQWKDRVSPSSIGSYLYNPIQFYQNYVLRLNPEQQAEEIAGDMTLGNIVHGVLEKLYNPFLQEILTPEHFKYLNQIKEKCFDEVVHEELLHGREVSGKNVLILSVAREMINSVLRKDSEVSKNHELIILNTEEKFTHTYTTPSGILVNFTGYIDRIDRLNGVKRILDYKTGSVDEAQTQIKTMNLPKIINDYNGAKLIQLAIYAYMSQEDEIQSGIYPLRYFTRDINLLSIDGNQVLTQEIILPVMEQIGYLIEEILDPSIPFMEPKEVFSF
ncbi:MAG: PD-(D/E)XK nuclease family protein [Flavobacteriaceae bacterium]|nr:PD-(D/E)XK nuclease family protein [Flavobacteriaceae bacterium]